MVWIDERQTILSLIYLSKESTNTNNKIMPWSSKYQVKKIRGQKHCYNKNTYLDIFQSNIHITAINVMWLQIGIYGGKEAFLFMNLALKLVVKQSPYTRPLTFQMPWCHDIAFPCKYHVFISFLSKTKCTEFLLGHHRLSHNMNDISEKSWPGTFNQVCPFFTKNRHQSLLQLRNQ